MLGATRSAELASTNIALEYCSSYVRSVPARAHTAWGAVRSQHRSNVATDQVLLKQVVLLQGDELARKRHRNDELADKVEDLKDELESQRRQRRRVSSRLEEVDEHLPSIADVQNRWVAFRLGAGRPLSQVKQTRHTRTGPGKSVTGADANRGCI
jgi:small-conductance mechanosensitive channel